jgi:hypothetical protein
MTGENEIEKKANQVVVWRDVPHALLYANIMQGSFTPYDVSIVFGQVDSSIDSEVQATPFARVTLTPEQASALVQVVQRALDQYTKQFGSLRDVVRFKEVSAPSKKAHTP